MTKRVVLDENLISKMRTVLGEDISPDNYVVYKVRAISTENISKRGCPLPPRHQHHRRGEQDHLRRPD